MRALEPKEEEWERNVASVVVSAAKTGVMEPAMDLMCNHSLLGPMIMKKLQVTEVPCSQRLPAPIDTHVLSHHPNAHTTI